MVRGNDLSGAGHRFLNRVVGRRKFVFLNSARIAAPLGVQPALNAKNRHPIVNAVQRIIFNVD
jgi:hypothetical protein